MNVPGFSPQLPTPFPNPFKIAAKNLSIKTALKQLDLKTHQKEGGTSQSLPNPGAQPVLKISLAKDTNGSWTTVNRKRLSNPSKESPSMSTDGGMADSGASSRELNPGVTSVAENVTSFITVIKIPCVTCK